MGAVFEGVGVSLGSLLAGNLFHRIGGSATFALPNGLKRRATHTITLIHPMTRAGRTLTPAPVALHTFLCSLLLMRVSFRNGSSSAFYADARAAARLLYGDRRNDLHGPADRGHAGEAPVRHHCRSVSAPEAAVSNLSGRCCCQCCKKSLSM